MTLTCLSHDYHGLVHVLCMYDFCAVLMPMSATARLKMNLKPEADLSIPQVCHDVPHFTCICLYQYINILTCVCVSVHDGSGMFVGRD